jgi:antirestriction protein ArdC
VNPEPKFAPSERTERAEAFFAATRADIHDCGGRAYYAAYQHNAARPTPGASDEESLSRLPQHQKMQLVPTLLLYAVSNSWPRIWQPL